MADDEQLLILQGMFGGTAIRALLDSGASVNFISARLVNAKGLRTRVRQPPLNVMLADGRCQLCSQTCCAELSIGRYSAGTTMHVVPLNDNTYDIVLGVAWLRKLNAITQWRSGRVLFEHHGRYQVLHPGTRANATSAANCVMELISPLQLKRLMRKPEAEDAHLLVLMHPVGNVCAKTCHLAAATLTTSGTLDASQSARLQAVIKDYDDVFQEPQGPPPERAIKHRIELLPGCVPQTRPIYRMSEDELAALRTQLIDMERKGWVRPSTAPFAASVLMVRKKDQTYRMVVDYRALNKCSVKSVFPLPLIHETMDRLHGARIFSRVDLQQGFFQIAMQPEDIYKTSFRCRFGQWEMTVMPMGAQGSPGTMQRLATETFKDVHDFVVVYMDDILIFSKTAEEHVQHVSKVMQRLREAHLHIKRSKCDFGVTELEFLGHMLRGGPDGSSIAMMPDKVEAIVKWPAPQDQGQLRSFLGLASYYRRFIKNFSTIAAPLTDLLAKEKLFVWEEAASASFAALKQAITTAPVCKPFDPTLPVTLMTDASDRGIGCALMQNDHPVCFDSKKFSPAEKNYPTHDKEALALMHALRVWRPLCLGKEVTVLTDSKCLTYLKTQPQLSPRQARWLDFLEQFTLKIEHIKGTLNAVADCLSRAPSIKGRDATPVDTAALGVMTRSQQQHLQVDPAPADPSPEEGFETPSPSAIATPEPVPAPTADAYTMTERVKRHRLADNGYMEAYAKAATQEAGSNLELSPDDLLYWQSDPGQPKRLYIPEEMRDAIMTELHATPLAGHLGMDKTYEKIARRYYWPDMEVIVRAFVRTCPECQRNKPSYMKKVGLLKPMPIPERRWSSVNVDFIVHLPRTPRGNDSIMVVVDRLSKRCHLIATQVTITAPDAARLFYDHIVRLHGLPDSIVSDRDTKWTSNFWASLWALTKTQLLMSSALHPQTNSGAEILNRCLEDMMRSFINSRLDDWDEWLTPLEMAYNDSVQASTKHTPFQLDTGQHPRMPIDLVTPSNSTATSAAAEVYFTKIQTMVEEAKQHLKNAQQRQKEYADQSRRHDTYKVGDLVLISATAIHPPGEEKKGKKFLPKFYGPHEITQVISDLAYRVKLPPQIRAHNVLHISMLKRYHKGTRHVEPPPPLWTDKEGPVWEVQECLGKRTINKGSTTSTQYLLQWKGFPRSEATWEPADTYMSQLDAVKIFEQKEKRKLNPSLPTKPTPSKPATRRNPARKEAARTQHSERGKI